MSFQPRAGISEGVDARRPRACSPSSGVLGTRLGASRETVSPLSVEKSPLRARPAPRPPLWAKLGISPMHCSPYRGSSRILGIAAVPDMTATAPPGSGSRWPRGPPADNFVCADGAFACRLVRGRSSRTVRRRLHGMRAGSLSQSESEAFVAREAGCVKRVGIIGNASTSRRREKPGKQILCLSGSNRGAGRRFFQFVDVIFSRLEKLLGCRPVLAAIGKFEEPGGLPAIERALFALRVFHDRLPEPAMLPRDAAIVCPESDSRSLFFGR